MIGTIKRYVYDTCLAQRLELKIENPFDVSTLNPMEKPTSNQHGLRFLSN
ncbi:MAG: hypothetical protein PHO08_18035 [Methylococcales bacterium]|nr:hypothetical protein [Methylococcales bacterium]